MTPRARLAVPGLGLVLALAAALAAGPAAAAVSPPCNERTNYVDCRPAAECTFVGGNLQCACTWDSVSDEGADGDLCAGQNEGEADELACLSWDAEKYPDQPFCKPTPCSQWNTLAGCVPHSCLVFYDINGVPCDPTQCAWATVSQDECDCHWDYPEFDFGSGLQCTDLKSEIQDTACYENPDGVNSCTANPLLHCDPEALCDVDENGRVDSVDVDAIYARLGDPATAGCDPADSTQSGEISIADASRCTEQCTYANCATSPPSGGGGCGIGPELALLLPLLAGLRRRRGPAVA